MRAPEQRRRVGGGNASDPSVRLIKVIEQSKSVIRAVLPKNGFARSVSVLVGGTASAQILLVLAAPLLTRLYTPEDFGLLAVYVSLLALIGVISSLRYELAIPLPEDDVEAANIAVLSLLLVVLTTVLSVILVALLATPVADALGMPVLAGYLWLLPVGILFAGGYNVFNYWSIRSKRFTAIAGTKLRQALATIALQLVSFKLGGLALLLGHIVGQSVGTVSLAKPALAMQAFKQVSWKGIWYAAGRYRRFPVFTTWAGLLNTGGTQLPPLLFAAFFSPAAAGLYALAHRVLAMPMSVIGNAMQTVFFSGSAAAHRDNKLGLDVARLLDILVQIGVPPAAVIALAGPQLFAWAFGDEWSEAGRLAQWMTPWLFLQFCTAPLTMVFATVEKQNIGLLMQAQLFSVRLVTILIGISTSSLIVTIFLFSLGSALSYGIFLYIILRTVGVSYRVFILSFGKSFFIVALLVSPVLLLINSPALSHLLIWALLTSGLMILVRYIVLYRYRI